VDILVSAFLDCKGQGKRFWSKCYQALPEFNVHINSSDMRMICVFHRTFMKFVPCLRIGLDVLWGLITSFCGIIQLSDCGEGKEFLYS
jgi:hypothetical protein